MPVCKSFEDVMVIENGYRISERIALVRVQRLEAMNNKSTNEGTAAVGAHLHLTSVELYQVSP